MPEPVISFHSVSKAFPHHGGSRLLRDRVANLFRPRQAAQPFFALRDVSFDISPGQTVGIIGHNGAGKSTLLSLMTQLSYPSSGTVQVNGRVAALLELGSGFHPDLTGSENVMVNAALIGLARARANQLYNEIVDFSGIGDFINEPLRTYSSGMVMRLAFSVAINLDPEILIIDEVLSVGDQDFSAKCIDRIHGMRDARKTLVCVSHSTELLRELCDRAIWLDHGRVAGDGAIGEVLTKYEHRRLVGA
jgi:ABC-type polysaccharide/polyol phosphate transport system ATPase subunit